MPAVCKRFLCHLKGVYLLYGIHINMMYTERLEQVTHASGRKEAYAYSGASVTETQKWNINEKGRIMQKMN